MNLQPIASAVGQKLQQRRQRLMTAESCTGGWIAQTITAVAGSSAWFEAGLVTYSNAAKITLLGVPEALLASHGAVSAEVVRAMVAGGCRVADVQWGVAVSGIAGPAGGTADKPVGTVVIAWQGPAPGIWSRQFFFEGDRQVIRQQTVQAALQGLLSALEPVRK